MAASQEQVGVIGAGSFGTAISNLLAYNVDVLLYSRHEEVARKINETHRNFGVDLSPRICGTTNLKHLAESCRLLFPIVPSGNFRSMMRELGPLLRPSHLLIHGTKGFDIEEEALESGLSSPKQVSTMSEIIRQESAVVRVGCLSGPNLASEIMQGQPTATVIASHYDEVIDEGKRVLRSERFHVFGTYDLLGAELAGALKNIIAIGSGILRGQGMGKNIQAMLITRGLMEMIHLGKAIGATSSAFFGTAGIGDLVATATSKDSRNFTFGYRLGRGETVDEIERSMPELAEGVRTLSITAQLARYYRIDLPITQILNKIVFEGLEFERAINFLMNISYDVDVDFL